MSRPTHRDPATGNIITPDDDAHAKLLELLPDGYWDDRDAADEARRLRTIQTDYFGTDQAMQAEIYRLKEAEARGVLQGDRPGPMLEAESGATGVDVDTLAAMIVTRADEARQDRTAALADIEARRRADIVQTGRNLEEFLKEKDNGRRT
jgi:hypothetical protein